MKVRLPKNKVAHISDETPPPNPSTRKPDMPQPEPLPDYDKRFKKIHEYIIECNPDEEWPKISSWINKKPNSIQDVLQMLNEHPEMKTRSRRLALLAEREVTKFELEWKDRTQVLRELAREYWEERKEKGMRKQITNDMIDDWILENYGNTYIEMYMRLKDMKNVSALMTKLADQLDTRDADFRRMLDKLGTKDATEPAWFGSKGRRRNND